MLTRKQPGKGVFGPPDNAASDVPALPQQQQQPLHEAPKAHPPRPFHSDKSMIGPARYSWKDLRQPMLRKSPFDMKDIRWLEHLSGSIESYCWKVAFGDQAPLVLKMNKEVLRLAEVDQRQLGHWKNLPPTLYVEQWRRLTSRQGWECFALVYEFIAEDELDNEEGSAERKEANRRRIEASTDFYASVKYW
ncbi:hypothetical protein MAPG_00025 [Magnaporthiopsis poae ATCC 64411]|uniref:Uncharacterized protein n=1 Tax=Magnaporthiopsis poae (strain ATCC 64411 / 73-15) TaxID=644358 RepID=A0A0C4DJW6_MAGP6|nr:hypothetical protein MAPG_00025 [Magnaporthiopsis poae ATCC 64411]